jgi:hypothetical protein
MIKTAETQVPVAPAVSIIVFYGRDIGLRKFLFPYFV